MSLVTKKSEDIPVNSAATSPNATGDGEKSLSDDARSNFDAYRFVLASEFGALIGLCSYRNPPPITYEVPGFDDNIRGRKLPRRGPS